MNHIYPHYLPHKHTIIEVFVSGLPRGIVPEKNERDRESRGLQRARGGDRVPPVKRGWWTPLAVGSSLIHLGVLRMHAYGYTYAYTCPSTYELCDFHAKSSHTYVPPTRDKHERVYVGSLLRKRNEMKRPFHRAAAWSSSWSLPLPQIPSIDSIPCRARSRVRVSPMLDRRTNDDRSSDACVHTCASTHSGSPLMSA